MRSKALRCLKTTDPCKHFTSHPPARPTDRPPTCSPYAHPPCAPVQATKGELIRTLQALTEGKMDGEIERARLTRQLARIKEDEGAVAEAAEILQEVAVVRRRRR